MQASRRVSEKWTEKTDLLVVEVGQLGLQLLVN
jgi:hypothetical protein